MKRVGDIAVKILRRRYAYSALHEVHVHDVIRPEGSCPEIARLIEGFIHDGHVCLAFERHGKGLNKVLKEAPLPLPRVKRVTKQMLVALERLHRHGYAHTDVKPDNILYDARRCNARLADLGNATNRLHQGLSCGTREYISLEVLLGAPLSVALDIWSLGCSVYEMLTQLLLFQPRDAAARKYAEFGARAPKMELDPSVAADLAEERSEQLKTGTVVGGRLRLLRRLGQGRFGTVWTACRIADVVPAPWQVIWDHAAATVDAGKPETERERADREWRRARGANDLVDLALNYEHVLLITALGGPIPPALVESARFRGAYFEPDGALRFNPRVRRAPLLGRLRRAGDLGDADLVQTADFLALMLELDPSRRASAADLIEHPWLASTRDRSRVRQRIHDTRT